MTMIKWKEGPKKAIKATYNPKAKKVKVQKAKAK
jgi:hypothetical protein